MITISLDEQGHFEENQNEAMYIGGVLYNDLDESGEELRERARLEGFYRLAIGAAAAAGGKTQADGYTYPEALHYKSAPNADNSMVGPVKEAVKAGLLEFFEFGTYNGQVIRDKNGYPLPARKGYYHLFLILKSDDGKRRLLQNYVNMLAKDDYGANLYFHMAGQMVNRIIFHNPFYEHMPSLNIDLATRSSAKVSEMEDSKRRELRSQGYHISQTAAGYQYISLMNGEIYRALISQEMTRSGKINLDVSKMYVKSIEYKSGKEMQEFLYLSDSLCSVFGFNLPGDSADLWLPEIKKRMDDLNPAHPNLLFGYDEIDNDFANGWEHMENDRPLEALTCAYYACKKEGVFAAFYKQHWFPLLEKRVRERISPDRFSDVNRDLFAKTKKNNLDQELFLYLISQVESWLPALEPQYRNKGAYKKELCVLYENAMTAYCHIGDPATARWYYDKYKELAFFAGVDDYLRVSNKLAVCYEDCFEWEKGEALSAEIRDYQRLASDIKREILGIDETEVFLTEGIAYSQLARLQALQGKTEAEDSFLHALSLMKGDPGNTKITQSYLLHYYAKMGERDKFEELLTDYFDGERTYAQRMKALFKEDGSPEAVVSGPYALYILLKGLYLFGKEEMSDALWNRMIGIPEAYTTPEQGIPFAHPFELIYKYVELFAVWRGNIKERERFHALRHKAMQEKGSVIEVILLFGDAEVADTGCEYDKRDCITERLAAFMKTTYRVFEDIEFSEDGDERFEELGKWVTYMYR